MPNTKMEEKKLTGKGFFLAIAAQILICAALLWLYHFHVLRPWEIITVDFQRLSNAKLAQLAERAMAGRPTNVAELETFIRDVNGHIKAASGGKIVFISGSIMNPQYDLTESIARIMGLDLSKGFEASLAGVANRVGDTVSRNILPPKPDEPLLNQER